MKKILFTLLAVLSLTSCEKMAINNESSEDSNLDGNVILRLSTYSSSEFTRSTVDISTIVSRINIGIFDEDGNCVKTIAQKASDTNYGTASITLGEGTYTVVAIGHNKENSVAANSMTDISFSGGPTDVFSYYGTINVTEEPQEYNLTTTRVVGMFRLIITDDAIPDGVTKMAISIAGGSIHLNPSTGAGGVNKTAQSTTIDITPGQNTFDVYTFPQTGGITANITVKAKTSDGTEVATKVFEGVPIRANEITSYRGKLFDGVSVVTSSSLGFAADPDWHGTNEYTF